MSTIGVDCYAGVNAAHAARHQGWRHRYAQTDGCIRRPDLRTASGPATMRGRQVDKNMFLADCKGTQFEVIKTFADVKSGSACKA